MLITIDISTLTTHLFTSNVSTLTGSDDSIQIVNTLLEVTSHQEFDISSMTFNFWHRLKRNLIKR